MNNKEFWFVVGSQFLYGEEVLKTVAARAAEMTEKLGRSLENVKATINGKNYHFTINKDRGNRIEMIVE